MKHSKYTLATNIQSVHSDAHGVLFLGDHGDCDGDKDCMEGLKCGIDNCPAGLNFDASDDCCFDPDPKPTTKKSNDPETTTQGSKDSDPTSPQPHQEPVLSVKQHQLTAIVIATVNAID